MDDAWIVFNIKRLLAEPFTGHGLTEKEAEAARKIAMGFSWKQTAEDFGISEVALGARLRSACKKLKLKSSKLLTQELFKLMAAILSNLED